MTACLQLMLMRRWPGQESIMDRFGNLALKQQKNCMCSFLAVEIWNLVFHFRMLALLHGHVGLGT